ncbi:hypothetical protein [Burkholderia catarinensis]|uniref:hypothetical protein n=1 Tax=Burkholderia catarinensis TaxID=1108140 RepID=UPI0010081044|nr:hypothetical protein [Burkholderia catarinensis]
MSVLARLRLEAKTTEMPALVRAVHRTAPSIGRSFSRRGLAEFRMLAWNASLPTASLEQELRFAAEWLSSHTVKINEFRALAIEVEADVLGDRLQAAKEKIDSFEQTNGWCFWTVELKFALIQQLEGDDALRAYAQALATQASPRIAALAAQVFSDRNDGLFSIDRFIAKCSDSFPVLPVSEAKIVYMFYRALGRIDEVPEGMAVVLSAEFANGLTDYYESFVDACCTVAIYGVQEQLLTETTACIRILRNAGFVDWRLVKAEALIDGGLGWGVGEVGEDVVCLQELMLGRSVNSDGCQKSRYTATLSGLICDVLDVGLVAQGSIEKIIKLGINNRGLTFGPALGSFAVDQSDDIFEGNLISPWLSFMSPTFRLEEILWMRKDRFRSVVERLSSFGALNARDINVASQILSCLESADISTILDLPAIFQVWIAREFVVGDNAVAARGIAERLVGTESSRKHATRILIAADIEDGYLERALERTALALVDDQMIGHTLPLKRLFSGKKWLDFRDADPILVACVAHSAFNVLEESRIAFICRMACREFKAGRDEEEIVSKWQYLPESGRKLIISFYERVWVDEYLLLLDFDSSQAVRLERLRAVQLLVQLRGESLQRYTDEIKSLTLQETLWRGLQDVNESRVFVNEAAILQWAERELSADYERWQRAERNHRIAPIPGALIRDYLLEQDKESFLHALSKENLSESTALLVGIVERLLRRFLTDPADGLNSYLSSRIRHGTLKGTILGPLEENGLIGQDGSYIVAELFDDVDIPSNALEIATAFNAFGKEVNRIVEHLRDQRVQIRDAKHPDGAISVALDPMAAPQVLSDLAQNSSNFQVFVTSCFEAYWHALAEPMEQLAHFISHNVKDQVQVQFDNLIGVVRRGGNNAMRLNSLLRTVATATQSQCDIAADWFLLEKNSEQQTYKLREAIEIAVSSAKNVNRRFAAEVVLDPQSKIDINLTSYGLSVIADCFYAILENAWKHSGLGVEMDRVDIAILFDDKTGTLEIVAKNQLAESVSQRLEDGGLEQLLNRYTRSIPYELVPIEGGSGLAKLASMTRTIDRTVFPVPLDLQVKDKIWTVKICVPLYLRGEAYDAYA